MLRNCNKIHTQQDQRHSSRVNVTSFIIRHKVCMGLTALKANYMFTLYKNTEIPHTIRRDLTNITIWRTTFSQNKCL